MNGENILLKLSPNSIQVGVPFGGRSEYNMTDVAGALAGLSRPAYVYTRVIVLDDQSLYPELVSHASFMALSLAIQNGWQNGGNEVSLRIKTHAAAVAAVDELVSPIHCKPCKGTGVIFTAKKAGVCEKCGGTGNGFKSLQGLADAIGVSKTAVRKTWLSRYSEINNELNGCKIELEDHMARKFPRFSNE